MGWKTSPHPIVTDTETYGGSLTTVDTYVSLGTPDTRLFKTTRTRFAAATQDLKFKVLGSLDGGATYPETVESEFTITAGSSTVKTFTGLWSGLDIQVKPAAGGSHGTPTVHFFGSSLG